MNAHPEMVAGTDRLDTDLMRGAGPPLFEGRRRRLLCRGHSGDELGIALKVEDGSSRAAEPALLAVLRLMDVIGQREFDRLAATRCRSSSTPAAKPSAASARQLIVLIAAPLTVYKSRVCSCR